MMRLCFEIGKIGVVIGNKMNELGKRYIDSILMNFTVMMIEGIDIRRCLESKRGFGISRIRQSKFFDFF
jgi:hypothetical protein